MSQDFASEFMARQTGFGAAQAAPLQSSQAQEPIAPAQPPRGPQAAPRRAAELAKPLNVLQLAKARLKAVEKEIKRLRSLEKERDELSRLIDAATNKPRAVVRDIKAARG